MTIIEKLVCGEDYYKKIKKERVTRLFEKGLMSEEEYQRKIKEINICG